MPLFDRSVHVTEEVARTVIERRAPTDDSIRLAREYEERAWEAVRNRVLRDIPGIDARFVLAEDAHHDRSTHLLFTVNGRRIHAKIDYLAHLDGPERIFEVVAREITAALMGQFVASMPRA